MNSKNVIAIKDVYLESCTILEKNQRNRETAEGEPCYGKGQYTWVLEQTKCDFLTINLQLVFRLLFSTRVDGHTGVCTCVADLCTAQRQHSAGRQHLGGEQKQP